MNILVPYYTNALLENDMRSIPGFPERFSLRHDLNERRTNSLNFYLLLRSTVPLSKQNPEGAYIQPMIMLVIVYSLNVPWKQTIVASPRSFYTSLGKPLQLSPKVLWAHQIQQSPQHLTLKCDHNR